MRLPPARRGPQVRRGMGTASAVATTTWILPRRGPRAHCPAPLSGQLCPLCCHSWRMVTTWALGTCICGLTLSLTCVHTGHVFAPHCQGAHAYAHRLAGTRNEGQHPPSDTTYGGTKAPCWWEGVLQPSRRLGWGMPGQEGPSEQPPTPVPVCKGGRAARTPHLGFAVALDSPLCPRGEEQQPISEEEKLRQGGRRAERRGPAKDGPEGR